LGRDREKCLRRKDREKVYRGKKEGDKGRVGRDRERV
jgi:hypothetical protein